MGYRREAVHVDLVNQVDKVIAFRRWDRDGPCDDVLILANFANRSYCSYTIGAPRAGVWQVRFNSDWTRYDPSFTGQAGQRYGHPTGRRRWSAMLPRPRARAGYGDHPLPLDLDGREVRRSKRDPARLTGLRSLVDAASDQVGRGRRHLPHPRRLWRRDAPRVEHRDVYDDFKRDRNEATDANKSFGERSMADLSRERRPHGRGG